MKAARAFTAFLFLALPLALQAQSPELRALQVQYDNALIDRVTDVYNAALGRLDASYLGGLDKSLAEATAAGDLEGALSLEAEKKRIASKEALPANDEQASKALRKLRTIYRVELSKLDAQRATNQAAILTPHLAKLKLLESDLTKATRITDAKAVMDYRQALALGKLPVNTSAPLSSSLGAKVDPSQANPPATLVITTGAAIEVASEIKAWSDSKNVVDGAVAFVAPNGGRDYRGARGILLKTPSLTGKNGSIWSFHYTGGKMTKGLQMIHPYGPGQVIIQLNTEGVGISAPASWSDAGYDGADTKRVKKEQEFGAVFPLQDNKEYEVVSRLDGQGGYQLSIDGEAMVTAHITKGSQFLFDFESKGLPKRMEPGNAALIVGPRDEGHSRTNMCREVRFWPSATR